mmetsp:Transcript_125292/g.365975  ORF Transcript_125292/g.365975 Transcript_125292/m.365975 type:complete len:113 (+) Transcript_125292:1852-2190(+)
MRPTPVILCLQAVQPVIPTGHYNFNGPRPCATVRTHGLCHQGTTGQRMEDGRVPMALQAKRGRFADHEQIADLQNLTSQVVMCQWHVRSLASTEGLAPRVTSLGQYVLDLRS